MNYKQLLSEEFLRRQARNPSYSLRAYAKSLGISPATLSEVFNGKRNLRKDSIDKVTERLCLLPHERAEFALSALGIVPSDTAHNLRPKYDDFDMDQFKSISDWYYFAILSLAKLKNNKAAPPWIAARLGIGIQNAVEAFARLERLGLIEVQGNRFIRTSKQLFVGKQFPSAAIRKYHRQNLEKAIQSLESDPIELRDFSSITMAIDPSKIEYARTQIREFREKIAAALEENHQSEVYTLSVQLFPISKKELQE